MQGRCVVCASILVGIGVIPLQVGDLAATILGGEQEEEVEVVGGMTELRNQIKALQRENKRMRKVIFEMDKGTTVKENDDDEDEDED